MKIKIVKARDVIKFTLSVVILIILVCLCFIFTSIRCSGNKRSDNLIAREAMYYEKLKGNRVQCSLCPRRCTLKDGERGFCNVRINKGGILYTLVYGKLAVMLDYPMSQRSLVYSSIDRKMLRLGTVGCNMKCKFCLSWVISQSKPEDINQSTFERKKGVDAVTSATRFAPEGFLSPEQVITHAKKYNCSIIAFCINESTIWYEFLFDIAKLAKREGFKTILATNGYINKEPLLAILPYIDGVTFGLKGMTEDFYHKYCSAELKPILETLKLLKKEKANFEITYVVIPYINDSKDDITRLCIWIKDNLGVDVPLHFYRYHPSYLLSNLPPTPISELNFTKELAHSIGIKYVYAYYNLGEFALLSGVEEKIFCSCCGKLILHRDENGHLILNQTKNGKCSICGHRISFLVID